MPDNLTVPRRADARFAALSATASAVLMVATPSVAAVGAAIAVLLLSHVALVDARSHRIPNTHLAGAAAVLGTAAVISGASAPVVAINSAAWGGLLLALHLLGGSLGFGDVKLGFVLGAALGLVGHAASWSLAAVLLASSAAFSAGSVITLLASKRSAGATPFAPGLVLATVASALVISVSSAIT